MEIFVDWRERPNEFRRGATRGGWDAALDLWDRLAQAPVQLAGGSMSHETQDEAGCSQAVLAKQAHRQPDIGIGSRTGTTIRLSAGL